MLVKATNRGFYFSIRQPGEVFELRDDSLFSSTWMEKVVPEKAEPAPAHHNIQPVKQ